MRSHIDTLDVSYDNVLLLTSLPDLLQYKDDVIECLDLLELVGQDCRCQASNVLEGRLGIQHCNQRKREGHSTAPSNDGDDIASRIECSLNTIKVLCQSLKVRRSNRLWSSPREESNLFRRCRYWVHHGIIQWSREVHFNHMVR